MVDRNDPLFRELQEELQRERYAKLWDSYGMYVIGGAALFIAAIAGYQFMEKRRIADLQTTGAAYQRAQQALDDKKSAEAVTEFETLRNAGSKGYATLARLRIAGAHLADGRTAEALTEYQALATDGALDPVLRGFARLQAASLRVGEAEWPEIENRLSELVVDNGPWRYQAQELRGIAALKAGKKDIANTTYRNLLSDRGTPQGIAKRASLMLAALAADEIAAKPATAATPSPATPAPDAMPFAPETPPADAKNPADPEKK